jgi:hypothetical protein
MFQCYQPPLSEPVPFYSTGAIADARLELAYTVVNHLVDGAWGPLVGVFLQAIRNTK